MSKASPGRLSDEQLRAIAEMAEAGGCTPEEGAEIAVFFEKSFASSLILMTILGAKDDLTLKWDPASGEPIVGKRA